MKSIEDILKRNTRVEAEKAWETSLTRRAIIAVMTYVTAAVFLELIGNDSPFINALVPFGGYIFSTLSIPVIKTWWLAKYFENQNQNQDH